jgi:hypothetical protein
MERSESNAELANIVFNELSSSIPFGCAFLRGCIVTILPEHVRCAMSLVLVRVAQIARR